MSTTNSAMRSINTIMMWLFCLTVLMLIMPWEQVSTEFASKIDANRIYLYFALIIEVSNILAQGCLTLVQAYSKKSYNKRLEELVQTTVNHFDFAEKALLREFVLQRKSVLNLPVTEPTVRNLIDGGVLKIVHITDAENKIAQVIISKVARPYITYKAIGLTLGKMTEEQISAIMTARHVYAKNKIKPQNKVVVGSKTINSLFKSPVEDETEEVLDTAKDNHNVAA